MKSVKSVSAFRRVVVGAAGVTVLAGIAGSAGMGTASALGVETPGTGAVTSTVAATAPQNIGYDFVRRAVLAVNPPDPSLGAVCFSNIGSWTSCWKNNSAEVMQFSLRTDGLEEYKKVQFRVMSQYGNEQGHGVLDVQSHLHLNPGETLQVQPSRHPNRGGSGNVVIINGLG